MKSGSVRISPIVESEVGKFIPILCKHQSTRVIENGSPFERQ